MKSLPKAVLTFSALAGVVALLLSAAYAAAFPRQSLAPAAGFAAIAITVTALLTAVVWAVIRGAWGGAIIAALAYPIVSLVSFTGAKLIETGPGYSFDNYVAAYVIYTVFCAVSTGWLTVPLGAWLGWKLASRESAVTGGKPTASPWVPSQTHGYTSGVPYLASRR